MKKAVFGILLALGLSLTGRSILADNDPATTLRNVREAARTYLASYVEYDDTISYSLDDMVTMCIEKFNSKVGKFDSEDILLIDGGIIEHYKKINRVTRAPNEIAPIDLVMIRFAFGGIRARNIGLSREALINECLIKIKEHGVKIKDICFYFDDGFIKALNKRIAQLNSWKGQKHKDEALNMEMELFHIVLSLWDMTLPEEYKKELISMTHNAPKDIREAVLKSKIRKFLPAGVYPDEYRSLVKHTISTILQNDNERPSDRIPQEKIVDLLVSQGFLYQLINDIDKAPVEDQEIRNDKVAVVLLSDQVEKNPEYFSAGEREEEWYVYFDHRSKIEKYNMDLRNKRYTYSLQNILDTDNTDIYSLVKGLFIKVANEDFVISGETAELMSDATFFEYLNYESNLFPEGEQRDKFKFILFCTACIVSWNIENNKLDFISPMIFMELSNITKSFSSNTMSPEVLDMSIKELINKPSARESMNIMIKTYMGTGIKNK